MGTWLDRLGVIVRDATLSEAILLGGVALAMIACRQPSRRSRIARLGILGSLALIPIGVISPLPRVEPLRYARESGLWPAAELVPSTIHVPVRHWLGGVAEGTELLVAARILTCLYLGSVAVGLGFLLLGLVGLKWLVVRARAPRKETSELYASLPFTSRRGRPRLLVSDRVRGPVLAGLVSPVILLPSEMEHVVSSESLRLSLRHELAHAESGDPWFALASGLCQVLWFFLPPLWWIRAQLRLDHEYLADSRAALGFDNPGRYAASLMSLAAPEQIGPEGASAAARTSASGADSPLYLRLLMLIRGPFTIELRPPAWWSAAASGLFVALTVFLSCLSWVPVSTPKSPATATRPSATAPHVFRMGRLFVEPHTSSPNGRSVPHELPVRLPPRFALRFDVWCDRAAMSEIRIAGHPLLLRSDPRPEIPSAEGWHHVDVRSEPAGMQIRIDGISRDVDDRTEITSAWLTIEPAPDRPGLFRKLVMTW